MFVTKKAIALIVSVLWSMLMGNDPINDPYEAAVVAAHVSGLNEIVTGVTPDDMDGTRWLLATGLAGTRLTDLRNVKRSMYNGTAIHKIDARLGKRRYIEAVASDKLRPNTCIYHSDTGARKSHREKPWAAWSTRGPYDAGGADKYKLMSQYGFTDCFPVELYDIPLVAALAASEHAIASCKKYSRGSKSRPCDFKFLRCIWAGIGTCQRDASQYANIIARFEHWMSRADHMMIARGDVTSM